MTEPSDAGGPVGPPVLTDDLVADLHAGVLDEQTAARLWPLARADRDAAALLAALDATTSDLRVLGARADTGAAPTPAVRVPDHVAARLDAALAGLQPPTLSSASGRTAAPSPPPGGPTDLAAARSRRAGRARRWAPGIAVAAAAVVVAAVGVGTLAGSGGGVSGTPQAAPLPSGVTDLGSSVGPQAVAALGSTAYGPLTDEATRAACLEANGVPAGTTVLGASEVVLDGRRGVLLLLPGPVPPRLTALVVGSGCGAGSPDTLARQDIGGR